MVQRRDPRGIGRKGGFKSLGSNLPQNAYKGKGESRFVHIPRLIFAVEKIREGLIHNAKVKRAYYRTLKREERAGTLAALPVDKFEVYTHRIISLMIRNLMPPTWKHSIRLVQELLPSRTVVRTDRLY